MSTVDRGLRWRCPECGGDLGSDSGGLSCTEGHTFCVTDGILNLLPSSMQAVTCEDAVYHEEHVDEWAEITQLNTPRNLRYHNSVIDYVCGHSRPDQRILEIGGGAGFDLKLFLDRDVPFGSYVFSEVSQKMLFFVMRSHPDKRVTFCAIDALHIPFDDGQFDCVFTIAALHHFPDLDRALREMIRVTRDDGLIVFGLEPNRNWLQFINVVKTPLRRLMPSKGHSQADEEAEGFKAGEFRKMAEDYPLELVRLQRVWLLAGFMHFGLELLYRVFRLKRRIRLPTWLENAVLALDRCLLAVPGWNDLCWHYTVVFSKRGSAGSAG